MKTNLSCVDDCYHFVMSWDEIMETLFPGRLSDLQRACSRVAHKATGGKTIESNRSLKITLPVSPNNLNLCRQLQRRVDATLQETFSASTTARRLKMTTSKLTNITLSGHISSVKKVANRQHRRYSYQAWRMEDILNYARHDILPDQDPF